MIDSKYFSHSTTRMLLETVFDTHLLAFRMASSTPYMNWVQAYPVIHNIPNHCQKVNLAHTCKVMNVLIQEKQLQEIVSVVAP